MADRVTASTPDKSVGDEEYARATVTRLVSAYAPDGIDAVDASSALEHELGYNSLRLVELSFAVEELFGIDSLVTGTRPPIGTVAQLQDFVLSMLAAGHATPPSPHEVEEAIGAL